MFSTRKWCSTNQINLIGINASVRYNIFSTYFYKLFDWKCNRIIDIVNKIRANSSVTTTLIQRTNWKIIIEICVSNYDYIIIILMRVISYAPTQTCSIGLIIFMEYKNKWICLNGSHVFYSVMVTRLYNI